MSRIRELPAEVAKRIAAGEVIERPVSVVKELVENSLDAEASSIVVETARGGQERIAVIDDGEGIRRADLPLAFRPHATSKIRSEDDLLRVSTLGFRGEALASIAAVSEVEVWTRHREETAGSRMRVWGAKVEGPVNDAVAPGCRIEVRDLFFNTPVRRKFLRSASAEAGQIARQLGRIALGAGETSFRLVQNGREVWALARGAQRARIRQVLGGDVESSLSEMAVGNELSIAGFASHPRTSFASPRYVLWFVNGRWVRDRMLQHALIGAYATLIPHGRFPAAVLFLTVEPGDVDVNVHPTKSEIRFRNPSALYEAISHAVRETFGREAGERVSDRIAAYARRQEGASPAAAQGRLRLVPASAEPQGGAAYEASFEGPAILSRPAGLRILGQVFDGYLVCQTEDSVVLIDQHAAHERVAFERLRAQVAAGPPEIQPLLVPQTVELAPGEAELVTEAAGTLAGLGIEVEPFGDGALVVRSVPALFGGSDVAPLIRALASDLAELGSSRAVEKRVDDLLATIACHSVVRVGQRLSEPEIRTLFEAMEEIDWNMSCPHGRPVASIISRSELERRFGR